MSDIVFVDTETLGLNPEAPVWEFAAVRRTDDGGEKEYHFFIDHYPLPWIDSLPEQFANDYRARYSPEKALRQWDAVTLIEEATRGAHVVGAVPNFDTERLQRMRLRVNSFDPREPWHYHLIDVENLIVGFLAGRAREGHMDSGLALPLAGEKWDSNDLSRAVGVDPEQFEQHTAMGDVRWVMAQWDAVMGGAA